MAILKSLKQKDKVYIFKSFENDKSDNPAKIIFNRFPLPDETFPTASQKNILDSTLIKNFDNTQKSKEKLVELVVNTIVDNITANRIDYRRFFNECISHIENLIYDNKDIKTIEEFFNSIPDEALFIIANEVYNYSKTNDEFTMEEKKI